MGDPYTWSISLGRSRWSRRTKLDFTGDVGRSLKEVLLNFDSVKMEYLLVILVLERGVSRIWGQGLTPQVSSGTLSEGHAGVRNYLFARHFKSVCILIN